MISEKSFDKVKTGYCHLGNMSESVVNFAWALLTMYSSATFQMNQNKCLE